MGSWPLGIQQKVAKAILQNLGTSPSEMSNVVVTLSLVSGIATVAAPECPDSEFSFESNLNDLVTVQDALAFHVCPSRILKRMPSNTTISRDHKKSVLPVVILPVTCRVLPRIQTTLPYKWQLRTAHQSNKNFECGEFTTENTNENDDLLEETYIMIYVKIIKGKTSVKMRRKANSSCHIRRS